MAVLSKHTIIHDMATTNDPQVFGDYFINKVKSESGFREFEFKKPANHCREIVHMAKELIPNDWIILAYCKTNGEINYMQLTCKHNYRWELIDWCGRIVWRKNDAIEGSGDFRWSWVK